MSSLREPSAEELKHALDTKKIDAGIFGYLFGTGDQTAKNIVGVVLVLLTVVGSFVMIFKDMTAFTEYWKTVLPVMTAGMGYLFGVEKGAAKKASD